MPIRLAPALFAFLLIAAPAAGQENGPRVNLVLQAVRTGSWSLREATGSFINRESRYDARTPIGVELGFAPIPLLQVFGSFDTDLGGYGDDSGYSAGELGVALRPWRQWPVIPFGVASYGRLSESGGVKFGFVTFGLGGDLSLTRALALRAAVRRLSPVGDAESNRPAAGKVVTVEAEMTRIHLGLVIRF